VLAIKFEADVHDGVIEIPVEYQKSLRDHIEVIALVHEQESEAVNEKSATYAKMMELKDLLGGDDLVEAVLKGMPEDFTYVPSNQTGRDIWFEERKHKYE